MGSRGSFDLEGSRKGGGLVSCLSPVFQVQDSGMVVGRVGMKSALRDPAWARQQQDRVRGKLQLEGGDPEETGITKIRQKKRGQLLGVTQDACALASSLFLSLSVATICPILGFSKCCAALC